MLAFLVVIVIVWLGAALGRRMLRCARLPFDGLAEELAFSAALGLGAFSLVVMTVGLLGWLNATAAWLVLLAGMLLLAPDAVRTVRDAVRGVRKAASTRLTTLERFILVAVTIAVVCGLIASLAPPTAWDAMVSHLKVPFLYLQRGGIYRLDDVHSNGPMNAVMLFVVAMKFGADTAPALVHLAFVLVGGLAVFAVAHRHLSRTGAALAAGIYFLMPIGSVLGPEPVVDFPVVAYVVLALAAFERWWTEGRPAWVLLAAVNVGLAMGTKYTGLHAVAIFALGLFVKVVRTRSEFGKAISQAAVALVVAVAIGCPWYVRNAVLTGNPVYPILADVIPTRHVTAAWSGKAPPMSFPHKYPLDAANFALFPVNATLGFSRGIAAGPGWEGAIESPGALFLALVPLVLLVRPVPAWAKLKVALAAAAFFFVVSMYPSPRYLLPFVVPCAVVAGHVFDVFSRRPWARRLLCTAVVIVFSVQLVPFLARAAARAPVVLGLETRDAYLLRSDDVYPMARRAAAVLPPRAKVFYAGERVYYFLKLGVDATMGMPLRQSIVDFPVLKSPSELLRRLRELGYTHVVVDEPVLAARVPFALDLLRALEAHGLEAIAQEKKLKLYEVER